MSNPMLTSAHQVCLVRAARERLAQLRQEFDSLGERGAIGNNYDYLLKEIECIEAAIRWVWLQPVNLR